MEGRLDRSSVGHDQIRHERQAQSTSPHSGRGNCGAVRCGAQNLGSYMETATNADAPSGPSPNPLIASRVTSSLPEKPHRFKR
jgi:hypothetical protein